MHQWYFKCIRIYFLFRNGTISFLIIKKILKLSIESLSQKSYELEVKCFINGLICHLSLCDVTLWLCVQVRILESANRKLELQIKEFYEKSSPSVSKDYTGYYATITELRAQVPLTFNTSWQVIFGVCYSKEMTQIYGRMCPGMQSNIFYIFLPPI